MSGPPPLSEKVKWANLAVSAALAATLLSWVGAWLSPLEPGVPLAVACVAALLLIVGVVLVRPLAVLLAWLLALGGAGHAATLWLRHGSYAPYPGWSLPVACAFAALAPMVWRRYLRLRPAAERPDRGPFGTALATRVADFLVAGGTIADAHAHGTGLGCAGGRFIYDEVVDGGFRCLAERGRAPLAAFDDRDAFIAWLAQQSDHSLSGRERGQDAHHDQRITLERLEEALRRPSPAS